MDRPILFNTEMVRAILDGRKTATRRIIKPQPPVTSVIKEIRNNCFGWSFWEDMANYHMLQPPCHKGDILWVRETFAPMYKENYLVGYMYKADDGRMTVEMYDAIYGEDGRSYEWNGKWKPSIHMTKEAARIFLKVTDVRVERLQDITEEDAKKEGGIDNRGFIHSPEDEYCNIHTALKDFRDNIWNSTIKKENLNTYGWDANPWVYVISFERDR